MLFFARHFHDSAWQILSNVSTVVSSLDTGILGNNKVVAQPVLHTCQMNAWALCVKTGIAIWPQHLPWLKRLLLRLGGHIK
jgi:hypothetical protein